MNAYLEILRPVNGIMAAVSVVLGGFIAGASGIPLIIAAISAFFVTGAGMAINDYFDVKIDRINRPKRPIPSGRVSLRAATAYSGALFGAGVGLALFLVPALLGLALLNSLIGVLYAWKIKRMPLVSNVAVSWMVGSTYIYGGLLTGALFGPIMLGGVAFLANLSREIYKTVTDYKGDKKMRARTTAVVLGKQRAKMLGDSFALSASLVSLGLYYFGVLGVIYLGVQLVAIAVHGSAVFVSAQEAEKRAKIGMFIGLLAILADLAARFV